MSTREELTEALESLGLTDDEEEKALSPKLHIKGVTSHPSATSAKALKCSRPERIMGSEYTAEDIRMLVIELKEHLIDGLDDAQVAQEMGLTTQQYNRLKKQYYNWEIENLQSKSTEQQYIDYCIEQERCLKKLDDMVESYDKTNQYNAMVGAVRAKSQILADKVKVGTAMGLIKKQPAAEQEVAGHMIATLDNQQMRKKIANELINLQKTMVKYGDTDILKTKGKTVVRVKH
jgi:hypothetical protein